jgi:hypothetical protein
VQWLGSWLQRTGDQGSNAAIAASYDELFGDEFAAILKGAVAVRLEADRQWRAKAQRALDRL